MDRLGIQGRARVGSRGAQREAVRPTLRVGGMKIEAKDKALAAAAAAQTRRGQALTIIEIGSESSYTDMLVIATAFSERQTRAIAEGVADSLKAEHGLRPLSKEGEGPWVLLDYGDVVVHVFQEDARAFYDLDGLWPKAPRIPVPPPVAPAS